MTRNDISPEAFSKLLNEILHILMKRGIKATSMDSIAATLQMSKRTLYELFNSKSEMVEEVLKTFHDRMRRDNEEYFHNSDNVVEAMIKSFIRHRDVVRNANVEFFRDLDERFAEARRQSKDHEMEYYRNFVGVIMKGVEEGYFRPDINYMVQCRLMTIQIESLKRMEEHFPPDISMIDAYDAICTSFLRSISTPKGMAVVDRYLSSSPSTPQQTTNTI